MRNMLSKSQVFLVFVALFAYFWMKYVKTGPIYTTDKRLEGKTVLITGLFVCLNLLFQLLIQ